MDILTAPTTLALVVNGEPAEIVAGTLADALSALGYDGAIVATAVNGEFVAQRKRGSVTLKDGDRVEIVAPRQGG